MSNFIRRHPAVAYFSLACALSWAGVMLVIGNGPIPAPPIEAARLFGRVYLAMLVGPAAAGLAMTAVVAGHAGLRDYYGRLTTWRVGARWYAVALATAPMVLALALVVLAPLSRDFWPGFLVSGPNGPIQAAGAAALVPLAVLIGIGAGFFEELGWTGFATPTLRSAIGVDAAGLVIGLVWGGWHFLAIWWGSARAFGSAPAWLFLVIALFSFLPPYRILMTRVYDRTRSTLVAVLMHASLTTWMILLAPSATGYRAIVYDLVFAGLLWIVVAGTRAPATSGATR